jgi:hypothetical protein
MLQALYRMGLALAQTKDVASVRIPRYQQAQPVTKGNWFTCYRRVEGQGGHHGLQHGQQAGLLVLLLRCQRPVLQTAAAAALVDRARWWDALRRGRRFLCQLNHVGFVVIAFHGPTLGLYLFACQCTADKDDFATAASHATALLAHALYQ